MSVGMQTYVRELVRRLPQVAPDMQFRIFDRGANFGIDEQIRLPLAIRQARPDLTHFLSMYVPLFASKPFVLTVHDLIHLRYPQYFKPKVRPYYQTVVRSACARAHAVITDDPRTAIDLQTFLGVHPDKVRVIPLGVEERYLEPVQPHQAARPYMIYAGNHRAHKDLPTMLRAWTLLPPEVELDLYMTGDDDFGGQLEAYHRTRGRVVMLGQVSLDALASYYAGARALMHPAICEGFGLPMLEAMAVGCAVIASSGAIPSVLEDAALTFAPGDARAAACALERVLRDEGFARNLVIQGQTQARALTWNRCAQATAQVYREIVEEQARR
jgi:glycosyltransferase involved in cell wall biosynthesis